MSTVIGSAVTTIQAPLEKVKGNALFKLRTRAKEVEVLIKPIKQTRGGDNATREENALAAHETSATQKSGYQNIQLGMLITDAKEHIT